MKKKIFKKVFLSPLLTSTIVAPFVFVSCSKVTVALHNTSVYVDFDKLDGSLKNFLMVYYRFNNVFDEVGRTIEVEINYNKIKNPEGLILKWQKTLLWCNFDSTLKSGIYLQSQVSTRFHDEYTPENGDTIVIPVTVKCVDDKETNKRETVYWSFNTTLKMIHQKEDNKKEL